MKKGYLIGLFAGCTLLMMGCSNQQKDPATDPDAPAVTDSTGITEGEAEVAGQGADMDTGTAAINGQGDSSGNDTAAGNGQNDANKKSEKQSKNQTSSSSESKDIGIEAAKKIALGKAGLTEQDGSWKEEKRDKENGRIVYELEFVSGKTEYEFEIDAQNEKILEYQQGPIDD